MSTHSFISVCYEEVLSYNHMELPTVAGGCDGQHSDNNGAVVRTGEPQADGEEPLSWPDQSGPH